MMTTKNQLPTYNLSSKTLSLIPSMREKKLPLNIDDDRNQLPNYNLSSKKQSHCLLKI